MESICEDSLAVCLACHIHAARNSFPLKEALGLGKMGAETTSELSVGKTNSSFILESECPIKLILTYAYTNFAPRPYDISLVSLTGNWLSGHKEKL